MSTELEARVRAATPSAPTDLDVGSLHERASARRRAQRRRRASVGAAVVILLVVALVASLLASRDDQEPTRRVDTDTPAAITWTRSPGISGGLVQGIATGGGVTVAVGTSAQQAAVWKSTDGTTWEQVYGRAPTTEQACQGKVCRQQDVQSSLLRVTYAHGRFVAVGSAGANTRGLVMTSVDATSWVDADLASFAPARAPKSNLESMLRDVVWFRGTFVVVGDLYTANKRQIAGLSPALWRSRDGTKWTRRVLDLGDGFDPYMDWVATRNGLFVATGAYRHEDVAWNTHDLEHWEVHPINRHGGGSITAVADGFVKAGGVCVPAADCGQHAKAPPRTLPTLWFSPDGEHWQRALQLPSGQRTQTGFGPVGVVGDTIVAVGVRTGTSSSVTSPLVYVSTDGRHWTEQRDRSTFPDGSIFAGSGARGDSFLVFGWGASLWTASP